MGRPALPDDQRPEPCELRNNDDTRIAAIRRHERAGETLCPPCAKAKSAKNRADYQERKARKKVG